MKKILVYGSLEFGKVIKNLVRHCGQDFSGFIDDFNLGDEIVGTFDSVAKKLSPNDYSIAIAVGYKNLQARWEVFKKVKSLGFMTPPIIHPNAHIDKTASIGEGSLVMTSSVIDLNVRIGELVVIWPGAVINHDSTIGANTFISPNATICGGVSIEKDSFVGAGSTIVDHTQVGPHSFIKAGSIFYNKKTK